jgi:hypothetical protein
MMKFQRQGCVLSNDYKELSITEIVSLYILLGSWFGPVCQGRVVMALSAKTGSHHVILSGPARQGRVGHVISGFTWCKGK